MEPLKYIATSFLSECFHSLVPRESSLMDNIPSPSACILCNQKVIYQAHYSIKGLKGNGIYSAVIVNVKTLRDG